MKFNNLKARRGIRIVEYWQVKPPRLPSEKNRMASA